MAPAVAETGTLRIKTEPYAEVFLGRRSLGTTPLFNVRLPVGTHTLRLVGPDKKAWKLTVEIKAEARTEIATPLEELTRE